jgi:hypothetical protein
MATLVSTMFMSLDGVAEVDESWHFPYFDENMGRAVAQDYETPDVLILRPGIEVAPWNAKVMEVTDPFGNRLRFNEDLPKPA